MVGWARQEVSLNQLNICNFPTTVSIASSFKQQIFKSICRTTPVQDASTALRQLSISRSTEDVVQKSVLPSREFKCTECGISVTCEASLQEHMKGKSHQAVVSNSKQVQDQSLVSGSEKSIPDNRTNMFKCEVCDVELTSEVDLTNHMGGRKHQAKLANWNHAEGTSLPQIPATSPSLVQKEVTYECQLCEISMTGEENLKAHKAGKKHRAKLAAANLTGADGNSQTTRSNNPGAFHCTLCDLTLSGPVDLENHKAGKSHQAKLTSGQASKEDPGRQLCQKPSMPSSDLRCDLCDVKFTGDVDLRAHMDGKKHKAKLGAARG